MAFNTGTVSVAATATLIIASNTSQKRRNIKNVGSQTVYLGSDSSVTTSNGFPLRALESINIGDFNGTIYGIVASSTNNVVFYEDQ